jgi:hypothetical protein
LVSTKQYVPGDVLTRIMKLQEKIDAEMKIHEAAEKLCSMYSSNSNGISDDKKARLKAKNSMEESSEKIKLLKSALSKYQSIGRGCFKEDDGTLWAQRRKSVKKVVVNGKLVGTIGELLLGLHETDSKKEEFSIVIQIDHKEVFRTKDKRNLLRSTWNEKFEIPLNRATEIEFLIYGSDSLYGLIFFPLQEIAEQSILEQWYDMEPNGQLRLRLNFQKLSKEDKLSSRKKGVERARHVEKRKIVEFFGHQLVLKRFYQLLKCATCMDMIIGRSCLQCEACMYTCHIRCKEKIFAKCISTSTAEAERENLFRVYRIPHRFGDTFIGIPTFCSHCGHILPAARKSKKCSGQSHFNGNI